MTLVGKQAPKFRAKALIQGEIKEDCHLDHFQSPYVLLFFYPLDFTFVCPTELHAFQDRLPEFEKRSVQVIGCSVDSVFSHFAWHRVPKQLGGIAGIQYPILADLDKSISRMYGVLNEEEGIAYRGLFIMDQKKTVRHALVNDLPIGRSVDEALRVIDALTFYQEHGEVCPANWTKGQSGMSTSQQGLETYFSLEGKQVK